MGYVYQQLPKEYDSGNDIYNYNDNKDLRHEKNNNAKENIECLCKCLPKRYLVTVLSFFGLVNIHALRVNFSVALVAMVSNKTHIHPNNRTSDDYSGPDFDWNSEVQGVLLSSFFVGCIISQIPSGQVAARFGGKVLFGLGVLVPSVLNIFIPYAAPVSAYLLFFIRLVEGLFEGATLPSIHAIWSNWMPPHEQGPLMTMSLSGTFVGTVLGISVSGVVAEHLGWQWVFYICGIYGLIWSVLWFTLVAENPADEKRISKEELSYIVESLRERNIETAESKPPWIHIIKSCPVWAVVAAQTTNHWGYYFLLTQLPLYNKRALHFNLQQSCFLASLPFFLMAIVSQGGGQLAEYIQKKELLSTTSLRKLFTCAGFLSQTIFFALVASTTDPVVATLALTLGPGLSSLAWSGFALNYRDLAPRYAGVLFRVSNSIATFSGVLCPAIAGILTRDGLPQGWTVMYFVNACVFVWGALMYVIFASGEQQPWAEDNGSE